MVYVVLVQMVLIHVTVIHRIQEHTVKQESVEFSFYIDFNEKNTFVFCFTFSDLFKCAMPKWWYMLCFE